MKPVRKTVIIVLAIVLTGAITISKISPYLFKTISFIKWEVLQTTPLGMDIADVYRVLKTHTKYTTWSAPINNQIPQEGDELIRGLDDGLPPYIGVDWEFDDEGCLVNVTVRKYWTP